MKREFLWLLIASSAAAYLFYRVVTAAGGSLANFAASLVCLYFIVEWSRFFYRLGLRS